MFSIREMGEAQLRFHVRFSDGPGDIALDDIRLICNEEFTGECACDAGYIGDGITVGVT